MEWLALIIGYGVLAVGGVALAGTILITSVDCIIKVIYTSALIIEFIDWKKNIRNNKGEK